MPVDAYLADIAKQGLGYLLFVVAAIVASYIYIQGRKREDKLVEKLNLEKEAHLASVKDGGRENREALKEMSDSQIEAIKEAVTAIGQLRGVADSTKQLVEFILNNRGVK